MERTIVKIENLVKRYGDVLALDHLNLEVKKGEIFGLLGPNGSGKSTAINCILALLKYDKGEIEVFGKAMTPTSYDSKGKIGIVMQEVAVFYEMNVWDNIDFFCGLYIKDRKRRKMLVEEAIHFVGLEEHKKKRPKELSGGLRRRLNIACGIAHKPELIILDEPTVAVDPQSRNKILEGITELNKQGATVIYTSHYMEEVEQICGRIAIIDGGKNIAIGTKDELKELLKIGETIGISDVQLSEEQLEELKEIGTVIHLRYENTSLELKCRSGKNNLISILNYLQKNAISFGRVTTELPTLNDVFLEITGKELRD